MLIYEYSANDGQTPLHLAVAVDILETIEITPVWLYCEKFSEDFFLERQVMQHKIYKLTVLSPREFAYQYFS